MGPSGPTAWSVNPDPDYANNAGGGDGGRDRRRIGRTRRCPREGPNPGPGRRGNLKEMDLAELLTLPGVREDCILRSSVGFMALHGGSQDRGTDRIASRAAELAGASYYAIVQPSGLRVHLTSRLHDPDHSARLRAFLQHVASPSRCTGSGATALPSGSTRTEASSSTRTGPRCRGARRVRSEGSSWEG